jgi:hypothetical protein
MIKESSELQRSIGEHINQSLTKTVLYPRGCFGVELNTTINATTKMDLNFLKTKDSHEKCKYPK